jgi:hypothetical protein
LYLGTAQIFSRSTATCPSSAYALLLFKRITRGRYAQVTLNQSWRRCRWCAPLRNALRHTGKDTDFLKRRRRRRFESDAATSLGSDQTRVHWTSIDCINKNNIESFKLGTSVQGELNTEWTENVQLNAHLRNRSFTLCRFCLVWRFIGGRSPRYYTPCDEIVQCYQDEIAPSLTGGSGTLRIGAVQELENWHCFGFCNSEQWCNGKWTKYGKIETLALYFVTARQRY